MIVWLSSGIDKVVRPDDGVALARYVGWEGAVPGVIRAVGGVEILIGGAWLTIPRLAAVATGVFLVVYSLAIGRLVMAGSSIRCACGGLLGSEPVSWRTLARNGVLVLAAGVSGVHGIDNLTVSPVQGMDLFAAGCSMALMLGVASQVGEIVFGGAADAR